LIRTIQRGTITMTGTNTTGTATISAVDTAKSSLRNLGFSTNTVITPATDYDGVRLALTNTTTVTATRGAGNISAAVVTAQFEVVEQF
jgi:hypothetical protein